MRSPLHYHHTQPCRRIGSRLGSCLVGEPASLQRRSSRSRAWRETVERRRCRAPSSSLSTWATPILIHLLLLHPLPRLLHLEPHHQQPRPTGDGATAPLRARAQRPAWAAAAPPQPSSWRHSHQQTKQNGSKPGPCSTRIAASSSSTMRGEHLSPSLMCAETLIPLPTSCLLRPHPSSLECTQSTSLQLHPNTAAGNEMASKELTRFNLGLYTSLQTSGSYSPSLPQQQPHDPPPLPRAKRPGSSSSQVSSPTTPSALGFGWMGRENKTRSTSLSASPRSAFGTLAPEEASPHHDANGAVSSRSRGATITATSQSMYASANADDETAASQGSTANAAGTEGVWEIRLSGAPATPSAPPSLPPQQQQPHPYASPLLSPHSTSSQRAASDCYADTHAQPLLSPCVSASSGTYGTWSVGSSSSASSSSAALEAVSEDSARAAASSAASGRSFISKKRLSRRSLINIFPDAAFSSSGPPVQSHTATQTAQQGPLLSSRVPPSSWRGAPIIGGTPSLLADDASLAETSTRRHGRPSSSSGGDPTALSDEASTETPMTRSGSASGSLRSLAVRGKQLYARMSRASSSNALSDLAAAGAGETDNQYMATTSPRMTPADLVKEQALKRKSSLVHRLSGHIRPGSSSGLGSTAGPSFVVSTSSPTPSAAEQERFPSWDPVSGNHSSGSSSPALSSSSPNLLHSALWRQPNRSAFRFRVSSALMMALWADALSHHLHGSLDLHRAATRAAAAAEANNVQASSHARKSLSTSHSSSSLFTKLSRKTSSRDGSGVPSTSGGIFSRRMHRSRPSSSSGISFNSSASSPGTRPVMLQLETSSGMLATSSSGSQPATSPASYGFAESPASTVTSLAQSHEGPSTPFRSLVEMDFQSGSPMEVLDDDPGAAAARYQHICDSAGKSVAALALLKLRKSTGSLNALASEREQELMRRQGGLGLDLGCSSLSVGSQGSSSSGPGSGSGKTRSSISSLSSSSADHTSEKLQPSGGLLRFKALRSAVKVGDTPPPPALPTFDLTEASPERSRHYSYSRASSSGAGAGSANTGATEPPRFGVERILPPDQLIATLDGIRRLDPAAAAAARDDLDQAMTSPVLGKALKLGSTAPHVYGHSHVHGTISPGGGANNLVDPLVDRFPLVSISNHLDSLPAPPRPSKRLTIIGGSPGTATTTTMAPAASTNTHTLPNENAPLF